MRMLINVHEVSFCLCVCVCVLFFEDNALSNKSLVYHLQQLYHSTLLLLLFANILSYVNTAKYTTRSLPPPTHNINVTC